MGVRKIPGGWLVYWTDERGHERKRVLRTTKAEAERYYLEARLRVQRIKEGLEVRSTNPERLSLADAARRYVRNKRTDDRLTSVIVRHIIAPPLGEHQLDKLTPAMLLEHLSSLRDLAPRTKNHLRKHIRAIYKDATARGLYTGRIPTDDVQQFHVPRRKLETLSLEEAQKILAVTKPPWRGILAVALHGLRKGEIWGLDLADVDLARRELRVRRSHSRDTTKTERERVVPIHAALAPIIAQACELAIGRGGPLFPGREGKRRNDRASVEVPFGRALRLAGIKRHVRFHDLRHTAASLLIAAGVPLAHVSRILGHSSIRTTVDTYGHLMTEDLHAAMARLDFTERKAVR
jgi:integrase